MHVRTSLLGGIPGGQEGCIASRSGSSSSRTLSFVSSSILIAFYYGYLDAGLKVASLCIDLMTSKVFKAMHHWQLASLVRTRKAGNTSRPWPFFWCPSWICDIDYSCIFFLLNNKFCYHLMLIFLSPGNIRCQPDVYRKTH